MFQDRVLSVENGRLYWSADYTRRLDQKKWCGCIDLAATPCEAKAVKDCKTQFTLQPLPGHVWSSNDTHSSVGTARTFLFDAQSGRQRKLWVAAISEHMAYAELPVAPSLLLEQPSCQECQASTSEECPVCLGELETAPVCRTACNHSFHVACLQQWLQNESSCPCCRILLKRPAGRQVQPKLGKLEKLINNFF